MSERVEILRVIAEHGWATCMEIVKAIDDPELRVKHASQHLSAMLADGDIVSRSDSKGCIEYADARARASARRKPARSETVPTPATPVELPPARAFPPRPVDMPAPASPPKTAAADHEQKIIDFLRRTDGPSLATEIRKGTFGMSVGIVKRSLRRLQAAGAVELIGSTNNARWRIAARVGETKHPPGETLAPILAHASGSDETKPPIAEPAATKVQSLTAVSAATPYRAPLEGALAAVVEDLKDAHIPHVPVFRLVDELPPIPELDQLVRKAILGADPYRRQVRADVICADIEQLLLDACDRRLDHELIKTIVTAGASMRRASWRLAET